MNWSRVISLDAWKGVALEAAWKITPRQPTRELIPSWSLNMEELDKVSILWPTKYQWDESNRWIDPLRRGFRRYVHVELADIPQNCKGIVLIQICIHGRKHNIAIDYSDRPDIDEGCARLCSHYF